MRFSGLIILLAALVMAGCGGGANPTGIAGTSNNNSNTKNGAPNTPPDNIKRVTVSELRDGLEQGKAVVVDVRGEAAYKQEHIKGALDIPETQLTSRAGELPKDKLIVFYCS